MAGLHLVRGARWWVAGTSSRGPHPPPGPPRSLNAAWVRILELQHLGARGGLALAGVEGSAELGLFFSPDAGEETRRSLDEYVDLHLRRRALPDSIERIGRTPYE